MEFIKKIREFVNKLMIILSDQNNIIFILFLALVISWYFWGFDNPFEETTEYIIKEKTGEEIDLSPFNDDPDKKEPITKTRLTR